MLRQSSESASRYDQQQTAYGPCSRAFHVTNALRQKV
jgi:hypothetical protein